MNRPSSAQLAAIAKALAQVYGTNIPDFDRAFEQLYTPFQTYVVDLSSAAGQSQAGEIIKIAGDFIYVDPDQSTLNGVIGSVTIEPNDQTTVDRCAFTANPGFALNAVFTSIKARYSNQPGKRLVLKYSTGYSVIPSFSALSQISGTVQVASSGVHIPLLKTATAASTQALAANAARRYFAANVPASAAAGIFLNPAGGAAVAGAGSFYVGPGQTWEPPFVPTGIINMIREGGANIDWTSIEA